MDSPEQGIVHVIGPELGLTQPGMTIVCGDSHTSTHGAFGALAFGIGTSVKSSTCWQRNACHNKAEDHEDRRQGKLAGRRDGQGSCAGIIGQIGTDGATGYVIEYAGEAVRALSMEGRMTLCNMSIEAGARAGMVAPDETTFAYIQGRRSLPRRRMGSRLLSDWRTLPTDPGREVRQSRRDRCARACPFVTWGTNPGMVVPVTGRVPELSGIANDLIAGRRASAGIHGLEAGHADRRALAIDRVFIGSCTNSRIEDLRAAARVAKGHHVNPNVRAMVVPGSQTVKQAAEQEGLHQILGSRI